VKIIDNRGYKKEVAAILIECNYRKPACRNAIFKYRPQRRSITYSA